MHLKDLSNKFLLISSIIIFICTLAISRCKDTSIKEEITKNDTIPLTKHWEKAIPNQVVPQGLESLRAEDCEKCHQEIYQEWKQSTHAVALQDLQFQAEWKKDNVYACLNCHIPLQNQQEFIVTGLINGDYQQPVKTLNPDFDRVLQQESITCATCHIRNGNVIGTGDNTNLPHKTIKDPEFLSEKLCIGCHNVVDELNPVLVCTFETGDEWQENWASAEGKTCITCHMPPTERIIADGFEKRASHLHYFPGSGIPKFKGITAKGLNGLDVKLDHVKKTYTVGEMLRYDLVLKNSFAGHSVPTGDPERFFMVNFRITDSDSNILAKKQYRIGEKWQWYPIAKKLSDNNMKPQEERAFAFEYQIPEKDSLFLIVEVSKHRMTQENAEYMGLLENYPIAINVLYHKYPIGIRH